MVVTPTSLVPVIVVLMMVIVGTDVVRGQLTAALRMRHALGGATLGQMLVLPVLAGVVIWLLRPSPATAGGLLLVAVSPGGGMSNYYCVLARLNVAFSVTLTTISGFLALVTIPLLLFAMVSMGLGFESSEVPFDKMILHLLLFLLLPLVAGITLRHVYPAAIERAGGWIRALGLALLVAFLALVFVDERTTVTTLFGEAVLAIVTYTLLALLAGWMTGSALRLSGADRTVVAVEFATRNVGIAALLALGALQQPEFAAFGALFLLFQAPILLLFLLFGSRMKPVAVDPNRTG